jgi:DNA-binding CsgD family transcriptional regulator
VLPIVERFGFKPFTGGVCLLDARAALRPARGWRLTCYEPGRGRGLSAALRSPFADIHKVRQGPLTSLIHRERDLLAALESGQSNIQLAREFGMTINTVKFHSRNLFGKLDVRDWTPAIWLYLETKR